MGLQVARWSTTSWSKIWGFLSDFQFSCSHVLMFLCSHVLMFSCSHVLMFSCSYILMFSSSHVFMFSCFHFIFRFPDFNFRSYFQRRIRKPKLIFSILDDLNSPPISTLSPFLLHEKYKFCQIKDHCVQIQLRIFSILNSAQG